MMDIISYRGPSAPGGVSNIISQVIDSYHGNACWWSLSGNSLVRRKSGNIKHVSQIGKEIVEGHYRYCNNFLWPLMHELPDYIHFDTQQRVQYHQFNLALAGNIKYDGEQREYFIQDYQLALMPALLRSGRDSQCTLFWHIPWPQHVPEQYVPFVAEIAESLLSASRVGFHTLAYASNFLEFVHEHLPDYAVSRASACAYDMHDDEQVHQLCKVVVQPVGVDEAFWTQHLAKSSAHQRKERVLRAVGGPYVLSVDRADYTKGVLERLNAIDEFFAAFPEHRQQLRFVQICQQTRHGLGPFDDYWLACNELVRNINLQWGIGNWQPIVWHNEPVGPAYLAALYENARVMLVNPLRDGLNLTAKEFVACSGGSAGSLLLSPGAGAWAEFSDQVIAVQPHDQKQMAQAIAKALKVSDIERKQQMNHMRRLLHENNLKKWWLTLTGQGTRVQVKREIISRPKAEDMAFAN